MQCSNCCPFVHNVPNDHHRTANICNNITCTDMIAALENSSIIYTPTCKVLGVVHNCHHFHERTQRTLFCDPLHPLKNVL